MLNSIYQQHKINESAEMSFFATSGRLPQRGQEKNQGYKEN
jgi:hypothetical protein